MAALLVALRKGGAVMELGLGIVQWIAGIAVAVGILYMVYKAMRAAKRGTDAPNKSSCRMCPALALG